MHSVSVKSRGNSSQVIQSYSGSQDAPIDVLVAQGNYTIEFSSKAHNGTVGPVQVAQGFTAYYEVIGKKICLIQ